MTPPNRGKRYRRLLAVVLLAAVAVAAALRTAGIGFGSGALNPRPDEELLRSGVLISLAGDLNTHYAVWGHLFHYLYVVAGAAFLAVRVWLGHFASWTDALAAVHLDPSTFDLVGRGISVAAGTATLLMTYRLTVNALRSRLTGACACIILATLFLHVRDSHFATSDVLLALNSTLALAAIAGRSRGRAWRAGVCTGLALATKLLAATVVATFVTMVLVRRLWRSDRTGEPAWWRAILSYLATAAIVTVLLQPFLLLDPMETCFGLFGDLFNPERRPFERGLNLANAQVIARFYVPQALGWLVGGLAVAGGVHLMLRRRNARAGTVIAYAFWSLLALVSVQRMFLRYVDSLLPVASIFAAHAVVVACRRIAANRTRLAVTLAAAAVVALPNLRRDLYLDHRLMQPDTRAQARDWIESNVPGGSRILWAGFGSIAPHMTMPWLEPTPDYESELLAAKRDRGMSLDVDRAVAAARAKFFARFELVALTIASEDAERSGIEAYPFADHRIHLPAPLAAIDRWARRRGIVTPECPWYDVVRGHVSAAVTVRVDSLGELDAPVVVLTGMPWSKPPPAVVAALSRGYELVAKFSPGEFAADAIYDWGDAWWLPNDRIERVERPGPMIWIYRCKGRE